MLTAVDSNGNGEMEHQQRARGGRDWEAEEPRAGAE